MKNDDKRLKSLMIKFQEAHKKYSEAMRLADECRVKMDKIKTRIIQIEVDTR